MDAGQHVVRARRVVWFGQFAAVAGLTVVVPLLPLRLAELGAGPAAVPWWTAACLAAPALSQVVSAPLWGALGDRFGRRRMVVRALLGLAVAVGAMALADTPVQFLLCRIAQGAFGGVLAATAVYATVLSPADRRGRSLGSLFGATAAGSLVGPLAGGTAAGVLGYEVVFTAVATLLVVSALFALGLLHEPASAESAAERPRTLLVMRGLVGSRATTRALAGGLAAQAGVFGLVVLFAPQVALLVGGPSQAAFWVGLLQALTWAASLPAARFWGARTDRAAGRGRPVAIRVLVPAALGLAVATSLQALPADPELLVPLRLLQGFCAAAVIPAVLHQVVTASAERARGTAVGAGTAVLDLGQVIGPAVAALAVTLLDGTAAFAVVGALFLISAGLAASAGRPVVEATAR
ncbi:hypothetical protein AD006_29055 (plasmid) [Pseudonocardia sp. EC080610-09]|nr:hypothetical protein AD006_29055 [Pseudonocardia sp. EC080610-09]ALL85731.1 hypothetical protein AD017_29445 [Pseudonocardia sp. EC080619-01]